MATLNKVAEFLVKALRIIGGACLVGMMALTCIDVVLRKMGSPIFGSLDIVGFLAVIALAASMPYTHQQKGHVGVSLLVQKFSERTQAVIDSITSLVSLILFAIVSWQMWLYAKELYIKGDVSMAIQWPKYPFIYIVSFCFAILCLTILVDFLSQVRKAVKG
jgi:TRAP-type C4-dicarboxylate transport system permease small subunit